LSDRLSRAAEVAPSLGISTLPELIACAKKSPGEITYATTGIGRLTHLTGELLQREAGIKLLLVPYTGSPTRKPRGQIRAWRAP
jgi:tripartite-type tricarboxylate transporter receptor subunit TctC